MSDLIGDRAHLIYAEQRIRDGLTALARWYVSPDRTEFPHAVVVALCPADVDPLKRDDYCADLLKVAEGEGADKTDLPFDGQVALDYMTGVR